MKIDQTQYLNKSLEALFKDSLDAIVHINAGYRIIDINQAFVDLVGYKIDEIKGMHVDDVMNKGKQGSADQEITKKILKGDNYTGEGIRTEKDIHMV